MNGLRTQENNKFKNFFSVVQDFAAKRNCVFFLDTGEGHDYSDDIFVCQDLSGWLIPKSIAPEFEKNYLEFGNLDKWDIHYIFAVWTFEGKNISIDFKKY